MESLENRAMLSAGPTTTALVESIATSVWGQGVTLTASVATKSGAPSGSVVFRDGSTSLGTVSLNSSAKALLAISNLPVGTDSLTAQYTGSSSFASSTSSVVKQTVGKASTTTSLSVSAASSVSGQVITLSSTVATKSPGTGTPTGTVTFKSGTVTLGTVTLSSKGIASLSTGAISVGTASIVATYNGSTDQSSSSSSAVSHTVTQAVTKTTISESISSDMLGQPVTVTVSVADVSPAVGTPGGTVTLYDGKTALGSQNLSSSGVFTGTIPMLFLGSHSLTAVYSGSSQCKTSTSSAITLNVKLPTMTTASDGLQTGTSVAGSGSGAVDGQSLEVNYTGYLQNGTVFDSSLNAGRSPFDFTLGAGQVITGWDQGLVGIKVGEQRVLVIPPALAYGSAGQGSIPANATLIFVVQLLAFNEPKLVVMGLNSTAITNAEAPSTTNGTNFGTVSVGKTGTTETFTITNSGNASLNFTGSPEVKLTGTDAGDFVLTQPVISGNAATFTITFKPVAKGTRTATITIPTNDPTYPSFYFTIDGTGD
jgi:hypothetical protein